MEPKLMNSDVDNKPNPAPVQRGAVSKSGVRGHLKMVEINRETGERKVVVDDPNVILFQGFSQLIQQVSTNTTTTAYIHYIVLGDDVGTGDQFNPEAPSEGLTEADQNPVYTIQNSDITFTYPSSKIVELSTVLDGQTIMDTYFPSDVEMRYTSATIRFFNNSAFSFKRFPVRSLSRPIDIQIIWTITFAEV